MPTYEDLRAYFQESTALQTVARGAATVPIVRGFTLGVDPLWALLYDLEDGLMHEWPAVQGQPPGWLMSLSPFRWPTAYSHPYHPLWAAFAERFQGYRRRDLYRKLEAWNAVEAQALGPRPLPVTMTIVHRPVAAPLQGATTDDEGALRRLINIAREAPVAVRVEERPPARLAFATSEEIRTGTGKSGTLGGVLRDSLSGTLYGVSCAHVAQRTDAISDAHGGAIGICTADTTRVSLAAVCDPVTLAVPNPTPGNGPDVNMLDCALVELSVAVSNPRISGVASSISPSQNVVLHGARSGTTRHKLGSLCLSYAFSDGGKDYCFRDTIELLPQPWGPLGGALGHMMTTVPTQGDSGGWVLTDDTPPSWAALFFGEDGHRGFAIRASWVHAWAEKVVGSTLTL